MRRRAPYRNRPVGTITADGAAGTRIRLARGAAWLVDVDVLVVGAGITGIYQVYRAREAGFSVQLLEAGGGVGGTWYWNRYPGARFDSESYTYAYLFSRELFDEWEWQEHFARATGDRALPQPRGRPVRPAVPHPIRRQGHVRPCTTSRRARGPSTVSDGTEIRTRFLIAATGVLSVPYFPDVPGRDDFRGRVASTPGCGPRRRSTSQASASR